MRKWEDLEEQADAASEAPSCLITGAGRARMLVAVFVVAAVVLILFQLGKQALIPGINVWQSHVITVVLGALAATAAAYLILRRYEQLYLEKAQTRQVLAQVGIQLRDQIDKQKELQTIIDKSSAVAFLRRAAPGWPMEFISASIKQFGYTPQDFLQGHVRFRDLVHPDDLDKACVDATGTCPSAHGECRREYRMVTRSGDLRWVEEQSWVRRDKTGAVTHCQGIVVDISERRQAEEASQQLALIVESSEDAIYSESLDGIILTWNKAAERIYGYFAEEAIGHPVSMLLPSDRSEEVARILARVGSGERVEHFESVRITKDGARIDFSLTVSPIRNSAGEIIGASAIARDITEKKRSEEAIRNLSQAIEQSPASVVITDAEGRIVYVNAKFSQLTGYSFEEALGQNPRILKSGEMPDELYKVLWETITAGGEWRGEFHNKKKNEELYWESACISGIRDLEGVVTHFVGVKEDITERKKAEDAIRQSEDRYRSLFESSRDAIMTLEPPSWSFTSCNRAALELFGAKSVEEFVSVSPWALSPELQPDGRPSPDRAGEMIETAMREGSHYFEWMHMRIGGEEFPATVLLTRMTQGGSTFLQATVRDVTERKQSQEKLIREHEITGAMGDLKSALLASSSVEEISSRVLSHAKHLTGSQIGFVGYIAPDTGYLVATTMSEEVWDACRVKGKDLVFQKLGGLLGWVLDNKTAILTNSPKLDTRSSGVPEGHLPIDRLAAAPAVLGDELVGLVALANAQRDYRDEDLSTIERLAGFYALAIQHMRADEALAREHEELARSNADLQQFAYVASHDLQEPLRMVSSYVQLLARRYQGKLDEDADEFIGFAVDGADRMQQLIGGLLEYSRADTSARELEPVHWGSVFEEATANLEVAIKESGATVTHDSLPTVNGDRLQLAQLLQNLIGNAVKFRGEDPPRIHVSCQKVAGEWRFSVSDNGVGIAPEDTERVFQMFERLHAEKGQHGTGIGLAICKRIVERYGGRIWVESQPSVGSTFYFTMADRTP